MELACLFLAAVVQSSITTRAARCNLFAAHLPAVLLLAIAAVVAIMLPTLLSSTSEAVKDFSAEVALSRFESVLMLLCYGLFLVFQLVTHRWAVTRAAGMHRCMVHTCMGDVGFSPA
jgi:Ca2+/H+ antiporter